MTTTQTITSEQQLLRLPVVCLATANFDLTVQDVVQGKATVIGTYILHTEQDFVCRRKSKEDLFLRSLLLSGGMLIAEGWLGSAPPAVSVFMRFFFAANNLDTTRLHFFVFGRSFRISRLVTTSGGCLGTI